MRSSHSASRRRVVELPREEGGLGRSFLEFDGRSVVVSLGVSASKVVTSRVVKSAIVAAWRRERKE